MLISKLPIRYLPPLLTIAMILAIGLAPDKSVQFSPTNFSGSPLIVGWGKSGDLDVLLNVLLFIPLGFTLVRLLARQVGSEMRGGFFCVVATSFGLSYSVEALQNLLPSRFPSFVDVLANSMGGVLGFVCFHLWVRKNLKLSLLAYLIVISIISIHLQRATGFSNWDKAFPLILGNELTGDRPWRGSIQEVYIADRAISPTEAERLASEDKPLAVLRNSLVAWYRLNGLARYRDETGHLSDLTWRGNPQAIQPAEGVFLAPAQWLETSSPASYLTQRITGTSQFTLGLTVATGDIAQERTARIVSLSADPNRRNFTLGQLGSDLVFRLRTPLTGDNGVEPQMIVPGIFSTMVRQGLVITYNGTALSLYVNGKRQPHTLELSPGTAAFGHFFERTSWTITLCKLLYYGAFFIPLGILLSSTSNQAKAGFAYQSLIAAGGIVVTALMLEAMWVGVSGRNMESDNLILSILFAAVGVGFHAIPKTRNCFNRTTE